MTDQNRSQNEKIVGTRRNYLKVAGVLGAGAVAGCTESSNPSDSTSQESDTTETDGEETNEATSQQGSSLGLLVSQGTSSSPSMAPTVAVEDYDQEFNTELVSKFFGTAGIVQSQLATGDALAGKAGLSIAAQSINQGASLKVFLVAQAASDYVMLAKNELESINDLEGETVAIEGEFENAWAFTVLPMRAEGADPDTVNFQIIGFSSSRTQAALEGTVSATPLHIDQARRVIGERDDYHIMAVMSDLLPNYTQQFWITTDDIIQNRRQDLVNMTKSYMMSSRDINANFDTFQNYSEEYDYQYPDNMNAEELYEFYTDAGLWPNDGGMSSERIEFMWDLVGNQLQAVDNMPSIDESVDYSIAEDALSDLSE